MNQINDLGYGHCPFCGQYKILSHFDPRTKKLKRKDRKRCCPRCAEKIKEKIEPFYRINRSIANHKVMAKEGDYNFTECMRLHALQGGLCAYCKEPIPYSFTLEHIVPRKFGGRNLFYNILLICPKCNSKKQHFELTYWLKKMKYKLTHRLLLRVKEAYDRHDYEFNDGCTVCHNNKTNRCKQCTTSGATKAGSASTAGAAKASSARPTGATKADICTGKVSGHKAGKTQTDHAGYHSV